MTTARVDTAHLAARPQGAAGVQAGAPKAATAAAMALVLQQVSKSYSLGAHRVHAVKEVSLQVRPGEMLALIGPSGSGKSSLLNIAGLIDRPDAGSVLLAGKTVNGNDEVAMSLLRRECIGFVFQSFSLIPVMTAFENVEYPLFLARVPKRERQQRVQEMLEAVGLLAHAQHLPDALSGGQRQRVAIARALIKHPVLVIADEPTASLDSQSAAQVMDLMQARGREQGVSFLFASHDARLVERCDRVLTLRDGSLVQGDAAHTAARA